MIIHYFGDKIYDYFHKNWLTFKAECGIYVRGRIGKRRIKNLTNNLKRVTCKKCLKLKE